MATVRCPHCGEEIIPLAVEPDGDEGPTLYDCPACRRRLTIDVVDEYLAAEEEEVSG